MRVEHVPLHAVSSDVEAAWGELAARAAEPNPFFEAEFVIPAARHLTTQEVFLVTVMEGRVMSACFPAVSERRWGKLPIRTDASWRHAYSFLGTPLVAEEHLDEACDALAMWVAERRSTSTIVFEWINPAGPVWRSLSQALASRNSEVRTYESFERPVRRPRSPDDDPPPPLARKRRKEMGRLRRGLEKLLGAELAVVDRADDPSAVGIFIELEAQGWKGQQSTAMGSQPGHSDFLVEVCGRFRTAGRLRLLSLEAAGRSVAMLVVFESGDGEFWFKVAHDEELGRFSPGIQLMRTVLQETESLRLIDSCADKGNVTAFRLFPDRRLLASEIVAKKSPLTRAMVGAACWGKEKRAVREGRR